MNKIKVSELPQKEKNAHNLIRVPAWVFGGLWVFNGLMSLLALIGFTFIGQYNLNEFVEGFELFSCVTDILIWSTATSLGLGAVYLILGFTYQKIIAKGKLIMIGIAVFTLLGLLLFYFVMKDFYVEIIDFISEDITVEIGISFFNRFYNFGMIVGVSISAIYYLIPVVLGYIGFRKLEKK